MYVCGDLNEDEDEDDMNPITAAYTAGIARMKNDGSVRWFIQASGSNPSGGAS